MMKKILSIFKKKETKNNKWCDDDCLNCEQNDNCIFSEVKKNDSDRKL